MPYIRRQIVLEGLRLPASIGVYDHERAAPQPVSISVTLDIDPAARPADDRIEAVLDYDFLRDGIRGLVAGRHFDLQETLAEAILQLCLGHASVTRARVDLRKTAVYPDCDGVGVTLVFER
ncbi:MAG: dihydroneopterin aldolase [Azospirillaceae bacterium]